MSQPELPSNLLQTIPWSKEDPIWICSSLTIRRNLAKYNFPNKISEQEKNQILQNLSNEMSGIESLHFYKQNELSSQGRELIYEHFLFFKGFEEPPDGSGMAMDDKSEFLALFNMGNHLEMRVLSLSSNWEPTWNRLTNIEDQIEKRVGFAFSPKFGYLTADPIHCGTGLTVNAYLHLPALIQSKQLEGALQGNEDVLFMGFSGNLEELVGDMLILQNHFCVGINEEAILHAIQTAATRLTGAEKSMRAKLKENPNHEIKDLISKAFGLLVHSYQLETKEALNLLSLMKLGLALGEIGNVSDEKLSELFFKCRRGYLVHLFPELKEPEEIAKKRAAFLQQELLGIRLTSEG